MSGVVFHHISEGVMAQNLKLRVEDAYDSTSILTPEVKDGNVLAADYILRHLNIRSNGGWNNPDITRNPVWGKTITEKHGVTISREDNKKGLIPDVTDMGARDAVYLLEKCGVRVKLNGRGKVKSQSIAAGKPIKAGMTCELLLGNN